MPLLGHDIPGSQIYTFPIKNEELVVFLSFYFSCTRSPGEVGMYNRGDHYAD
jgi:hypothetical protein